MKKQRYKEGIATWIRIHMGNLPPEKKQIIINLLDTQGCPKYHRPTYLLHADELAEWCQFDTYPTAWIEEDGAPHIATMFCQSQSEAFRIRKELRTLTGQDQHGWYLLEGRIYFYYEQGQEPSRYTG